MRHLPVQIVGRTVTIPEIDGFRGIAICAVVLHHLFSQPLTDLHLRLIGIPLNPVLGNGWLGVNLFFVLSGFVLYLPYASNRRVLAGAADCLAFYRHRALRLLPAYYFATIAMLALGGRPPFGDWKIGIETVSLLTFTFPFLPSYFSPSLNWALWSIGTEVLFSAVFPMLCFACRHFGALRLLLICIPISMTVRYLGHTFDPHHVTWLGDGLLVGRTR